MPRVKPARGALRLRKLVRTEKIIGGVKHIVEPVNIATAICPARVRITRLRRAQVILLRRRPNPSGAALMALPPSCTRCHSAAAVNAPRKNTAPPDDGDGGGNDESASQCVSRETVCHDDHFRRGRIRIENLIRRSERAIIEGDAMNPVILEAFLQVRRRLRSAHYWPCRKQADRDCHCSRQWRRRGR